MKTSALVLTIVGSSLLSALTTSALWVLADGLRPSAPAFYVRVGNPLPPPAAPAPAPVAAPAPLARAGDGASAPVLVAPGAVLPDDATDGPSATAAPPLGANDPLPAPALPAAEPAAMATSTVDAAVAAPVPASAPAPEMAVAASPVAEPPATPEPGDAAGDDATTAVDTVAVPATEIVYRDTYLSYLGYDATQIDTIPWYCRHFHLAEDEVLCVCFIAHAAQVPFGTAIVAYVQDCGSSCQALLAYYHVSALIFFITPGDDLRFPAPYQRPYRWLRDGAQVPIRFSNQEFQDLLALKLSTDYLRAAPQDFFAAAQGSAPLHLMRGTALRAPAPTVVRRAAPAPADAAPGAEEPPPRTEPVEEVHALAPAPTVLTPQPRLVREPAPGAAMYPNAIATFPAPPHAGESLPSTTPGVIVTPAH